MIKNSSKDQNSKSKKKAQFFFNFDENFFKDNHKIFKAVFEDDIELVKTLISEESNTNLLEIEAVFPSNEYVFTLPHLANPPKPQIFQSCHMTHPFEINGSKIGLAEVAICGGALNVLQFLNEKNMLDMDANLRRYFFEHIAWVTVSSLAIPYRFLKKVRRVHPTNVYLFLNLPMLAMIYGNQHIVNFTIDRLKVDDIERNYKNHKHFHKHLMDIMLVDYKKDIDIFSHYFQQFLEEFLTEKYSQKYESILENNFYKISFFMNKLYLGDYAKLSIDNNNMMDEKYIQCYLSFYEKLIVESFNYESLQSNKFLKLALNYSVDNTTLDLLKNPLQEKLLNLCKAKLDSLQIEELEINKYSKIFIILEFLRKKFNNIEAAKILIKSLLKFSEKSDISNKTKELSLFQCLFLLFNFKAKDKDADDLINTIMPKILGCKDSNLIGDENIDLYKKIFAFVNSTETSNVKKVELLIEYKRLIERREMQKKMQVLNSHIKSYKEQSKKNNKALEELEKENSMLNKNILFLKSSNKTLISFQEGLEKQVVVLKEKCKNFL